MASENSQIVERASQIFLILGGIDEMIEGWHCGDGRLTDRASAPERRRTSKPMLTTVILVNWLLFIAFYKYMNMLMMQKVSRTTQFKIFLAQKKLKEGLLLSPFFWPFIPKPFPHQCIILDETLDTLHLFSNLFYAISESPLLFLFAF